MILNVATDQPLSPDYVSVMRSLIKSEFADKPITALEVIDRPDQANGPVLVIGAPDEFTGDTYVRVPSVKATLGTAGGVTKLTHGLRRMLRPEAEVPCTWEAVGMRHPDTGEPLTSNLATREWSGYLVAVDIEVSGDISVDEPDDTDLLSIAFARMAPLGNVEVMVYGIDAMNDPLYRLEVAHLLQCNKLITHNGKFDFRWLNRLLVDVLDGPLYPDEDTMIMHHGMWPGAAEHGLKELAARIFGAPDWEADIKRFTKGSKAHYERIPQHILVKYNAMDVYWTTRLWYRLRDMMTEEAKALYYNHALPASHMLQDVEQFGMAVDLEYAGKLDELMTGEIEQLLDRLQEFACIINGNEKFNPRSPQQVKKIFSAMGLGLSSTAEAVLTNIAMHTDNEEVKQFIVDLLEYRGVTKAHGTYVKGISRKARGGRVHSSFLVHGTVSGRLSSRGPNLQNITNEVEGRPSIRRMFIAEDGNMLAGCDYAQAELRTMAELSGDEKMIADLQEDSPDFFDNMMPHVFPDTDFTDLSKNQRKPYRLKLKRVVYGTSYGLTPRSVSFMLTLAGAPTTVQEAAAIQTGYLGFYPGLQKWRLGVLPAVEAGDDLLTPFGRRFQQDVVTEANRHRIQNQAWAFQPQSIASDICVSAAMDVHTCFTKYNKDRGWHIIALVHDAIYAEGPSEHAEWAKAQIQGYMRASAERIYHRVPFLVDGKIGKSWDLV